MIEVQEVGGTFLPASELHMRDWLLKEKQVRNGRLCYQLNKLDMCLTRIPAQRRRVAVDCGAHVGTWSMNLVDEFDHVIAFEPSARADIYPMNVQKPNYTLHRFALGDRSARVAMQETPHSTGACYVIPDTEGDVEMRTLDSFDIAVADFIKVDVEGQEVPWVNGACETLLRCRPFVLVEQKGWNAQHVRDGNRDAVRLLEALGMRVVTEYSGDVFLGWT